MISPLRRNQKRFPSAFMFQLSLSEIDVLRSQIATSSWRGRRTLPYAFTEQGVAMLSSVLNSERAIQVNIQIMRTFSNIRQMLEAQKNLRAKIEAMEQKYDSQFKVVFDALKKLLEVPKNPAQNRIPHGEEIGW